MAIIERKASDGSIVDEKGQVSADVLEALPTLGEKKADLNAIGDVSPLLLSVSLFVEHAVSRSLKMSEPSTSTTPGRSDLSRRGKTTPSASSPSRTIPLSL